MTARRLQDFEGAWAFERRIIHAGGQEAVVTGRAVWTRDGSGLVCEEAGEMRTYVRTLTNEQIEFTHREPQNFAPESDESGESSETSGDGRA